MAIHISGHSGIWTVGGAVSTLATAPVGLSGDHTAGVTHSTIRRAQDFLKEKYSPEEITQMLKEYREQHNDY